MIKYEDKCHGYLCSACAHNPSPLSMDFEAIRFSCWMDDIHFEELLSGLEPEQYKRKELGLKYDLAGSGRVCWLEKWYFSKTKGEWRDD